MHGLGPAAGDPYRPDPGRFETRGIIRRNGVVFEYPEDYPHAFGFTAQMMTPAQQMRIEAGLMLAHPGATVTVGLWWAVVWLSFAAGPVLLRGGRQGRVARVTVITLPVIGASMLALVSVGWALWAPTTGTALLAHMAIGGLLAGLVLCWDRRRRSRPQPSGT